MTSYCVSITKTLVKGVKLTTDRYKKLLTEKVNFSAKMNKCQKKNSYIFLHKNDCETPYIDIYVDLLSINFNLLPVLYCANNNMITKYIVLSNMITVVSDNILRISIQEPLLILTKFIVLLHTLSAYNSLFVRLKVYLV